MREVCGLPSTNMEQKDVLVLIWLGIGALSQPVFSDDWKATVVKNMNALVSSCVVVPCTFSYPSHQLPSSRLRGIWHEKGVWDQIIYHEDSVKISDNFKGRTKLLGHLGHGNCTLEIDDVKNHDNGPFCFRIEIPELDKFSFVEDCVRLTMLPNPPKPALIAPITAMDGQPFSIMCIVTHTCPSSWPKLTWSHSSHDNIITHHRDHGDGKWETISTLTFIPQEKDDHTEITCTARFSGGSTSSVAHQLYLKRKESIWYIIIPVSVGIGTALMLGALGVWMRKKYKRQIEELRNGGGNSMWDRMSYRFRSLGRGEGRLQAEHRQGNKANCRANNTKPFSKPRCPSPERNKKQSCAKLNAYSRDGYDDSEVNIYGNL